MKLTKEFTYNYILPILLFLISFLWKLNFINTRDICLDEPFSIFHAQMEVSEIISILTKGNNPPLFEIILHFWIKLFGISPFSVRLLPLIFNSLTVLVIYFIGKNYFKVSVGVLASFLFIFSTYHFYFGLETRTYSLFSFATAASLYFYLKIINKPNSLIQSIALIISNLILIYSHYFGWFVVFVQFAAGLMYFKEIKILKIIFFSTLITSILYIPLAAVFVKQLLSSSAGTWLQPPASSEYLNQIYWFLNSKSNFKIISIVLFLGIVYYILKHKPHSIKKDYIIMFLWWFVPYTIMFLVSFEIPMFLNRYILFNTIGLYLFIAIVVSYTYKGVLLYISSVLIVLFFYLNLQINSKEFYYREVKNLVSKVNDSKTDNSIILIYPYWADLGFMYYYNRDIFKDFKNYDSLLYKNEILHVWNFESAKEYIDSFSNKDVLYIQDGQLGDNKIYNYLDSLYVRKDSAFYPQCFQFGFFCHK